MTQDHESGCGPLCVKIATEYFGMNVSLDNIKERSGNWSEEGMGNEDLVKVLKEFGLDVQIKNNSTWGDLMRNNVSDKLIIVSFMLRGYIGHFSIVDSITDKDITILDTEKGVLEKIDKIKFMRIWFDYDDKWYPEKNTDIQLRWMAIVSNKK